MLGHEGQGKFQTDETVQLSAKYSPRTDTFTKKDVLGKVLQNVNGVFR